MSGLGSVHTICDVSTQSEDH